MSLAINKNFDSTWAKIVPYLNYSATHARASDYDPKRRDLYKTAEKAIYAFICRSCDRGFFKVGLNTKINALDAWEAAESDTGGILYRPQIEESIRELLEALEKTSPEKNAHCSDCQCKPIDPHLTNEQQQIVSKQITGIYRLAQSFMEIEIGSGMIVGAKLLGQYL